MLNEFCINVEKFSKNSNYSALAILSEMEDDN